MTRCFADALACGLAVAAIGCGGGSILQQNPAPSIQNIFPAFVVAGLGGQTVTVTGANFVRSTTATLGNKRLAITFVNSMTLGLSLTGSDVATTGTQTIFLTNPMPGGGRASVNLAVLASYPAPTIDSVSPPYVVAGTRRQIGLTGSNLTNVTTVTFGGVTHTATLVNSTTMRFQLDASDLATVGTKSIVITNPTPGGGMASFNVPVLLLNDAMLDHSQVSPGDQARLQRLIEKGRNGVPVTLAAIGGSITAGAAASDPAHRYLNLLQVWWNGIFPLSTSTLVNAGIGSTSSDYGSLRVQRDVLSQNPDLVIVEFAVNDKGGGVSAFGDTYEGLVRHVLDAPSHPAVILLFMMTYGSPIEASNVTAQPWQSAIGANYNLPMVSYFDALSPELTSGDITLQEITPDGIHPTDLGHAYAALFLETNLQTAMKNFPPRTELSPIPLTQAPLHSRDFEFTSLVDGIGEDGPPLDPTENVGWTPEPTGFYGTIGYADGGLQSSDPGSMLDFTVKGKEILIGYYVHDGPMGQASVTVDDVPAPILHGWFSGTWGGYRGMSRVANGLDNGKHVVHVELLNTKDSGSMGTFFRVLCVGTGGLE